MAEASTAPAKPTTYSNDPTLYLYTSLTSGSSHIVTATSRMETILKANRIPFLAIDIATDEKARMLWGRRAGKDESGRVRKIPGLVQMGLVLGDLVEVDDWNEYGELKQHVKIVGTPNYKTGTPKPAAAKPTIAKENIKPVAVASSSKTAETPKSPVVEKGGQAAMSLAIRQAGEQAAQKAKDNKKKAVDELRAAVKKEPAKEVVKKEEPKKEVVKAAPVKKEAAKEESSEEESSEEEEEDESEEEDEEKEPAKKETVTSKVEPAKKVATPTKATPAATSPVKPKEESSSEEESESEEEDSDEDEEEEESKSSTKTPKSIPKPITTAPVSPLKFTSPDRSILQSPTSTAWKPSTSPFAPMSVVLPTTERTPRHSFSKTESVQSPGSTAWRPTDVEGPVRMHRGSTVSEASVEEIRRVEEEEKIAEVDSEEEEDDEEDEEEEESSEADEDEDDKAKGKEKEKK